ncbi:MAG: preprotein translocase subunit SecA [bacterium]|jgi:preprotein translocase subunit SecA
MVDIIGAIFDTNKREIARLRKQVEPINALESKIKQMTDQQITARASEIRDAIRAEVSKLALFVSKEDPRYKTEHNKLDRILGSHLTEVFALTRECAVRTLNMRHFDVQLIGGIVLHEGRIAEMKTGEGKTLVATLAATLNGMTGLGVHVITVNDYLARRDAEWKRPIYEMMGLTVGCILHDQNKKERYNAYRCDITYGTNNEFGFDYLRDHMVMRAEDKVQRDLVYGIVDEVDSILIDEARTPLIISGSSNEDVSIYSRVDSIVRRLKPKNITGEDRPKDIFEQLESKKHRDDSEVSWDYEYDEKGKTVALTSRGQKNVEAMLGIDNLYDFDHKDLAHAVQQSLRAHALFGRDKDYIVKDGQVIIVDEFTGRLMFGRRYSDGLHQAIEAKEGVKVAGESQTLATITLQNYFRLYHKLAGMTGTAKTEEEEFKKIYGFDVVVIPTNMPMIRKDHNDVIYKTEKAKYEAIIKQIEECHAKKQPVLVGTITIENSEKLAKYLAAKRIPHEVLNAKFHEKEAYIVAQAGRAGAVTIATNMAGRGTDIVLGGNAKFLARYDLFKRGLDPMAPENEAEVEALSKKYEEECRHGREVVINAGGLYILGTERHESRRIDNQLRGRSGRQGDPGESRFFLSLEDDLMRLYGMDRLQGWMDRLNVPEDQPIEAGIVTMSIERAQKKVEARNFDIRRHVLQYDDVMNKQRSVIYTDRENILKGADMREQVVGFIESAITDVVYSNIHQSERGKELIDIEGLWRELNLTIPVPDSFHADELKDKSADELVALLCNLANDIYEAKELEIGKEIMRELERYLTLRSIDEHWIDHLNVMDHLREGIGLRVYGQEDPVAVYAKEAFDHYETLKATIQKDVVSKIFRVRVREPEQEKKSAYNIAGYSSGEAGVQGRQRTFRRKVEKVGRNDPCPCGSGKKYKNCHGKEEEGGSSAAAVPITNIPKGPRRRR